MDSILDKMNVECIFSVEISDSKEHVIFREECDEWYNVSLCKESLSKLIEELTAIRDEMV